MKLQALCLASSVALMVLTSVALPTPEEALKAQLPEIFGKAAEHYRALDAAAERLSGQPGKGGRKIPHGYKRKLRQLDMRPVKWWTAGHFPGSLWYLYEATGDEAFKVRALNWTKMLAANAKVTDNHDVGFIMYCSYGNARRILKTDCYDALLKETAASLVKRYNPKLGLIRSWGAINETKNFLVIPDNLMNLELLEWSAKHGKPEHGDIAISHARLTAKNHYRSDAGCYHVLDYDLASGAVKRYLPGQGLSTTSAWARGQSWSVYGYTMMYRETRLPEFLDQAVRCANFAIDNPAMPEDGIPYWDFGARGEERDSSAGAILASALLELSQFVDAPLGRKYRAFAIKELQALSSPNYFSEGDEIGHFLLKHGVGHKPAHSEIDTPLDYGDYYFLEALLRFRKLTN